MYTGYSSFELNVLYYGAVSACCSAACVLEEDDEEAVFYARNKLYSALYDMTEFLILRAGKTPPASLEFRIFRVAEIYGDSCRPPYICRRLLDRSTYLYRDELALIAQVLDTWFILKCKRFIPGNMSCSTLHSYVE